MEVVDARACGSTLKGRWVKGMDMASGLNKVLEHLRRALPSPDRALTDGQLLARFVSARDEAAFAALLLRHGPMVLAACRRLLRHEQDAEDCFQAAFLVLARKASSVRGEALGGWLHSVACRTALAARTARSRVRARERQVEAMPHPEMPPVEPQDWRPWLDHELGLLPDKYRAVIVACDLEGRPRREAARDLGLSEGTVSSRLARGRCLLAKRLSRYGLSLSGGALAAALAEGAVSAHVPTSLLSATTKAAVGQLVVSGSVEVLVKGALKTMLMSKLKLAAGAVMVMVALGASGLAYRASGQPAPAGAEKASAGRPATELEILRQEVELLKLKLEVVQEKQRAQEAELRALKGRRGETTVPSPAAPATETRPDTNRNYPHTPAHATRVGTADQGDKAAAVGPGVPVSNALPDQPKRTTPAATDHAERPRGAREVEAALEELREAPDELSRRRAMERLEKALRKQGVIGQRGKVPE
jgi:RNA polymerase sigma factor (sigma-70 family)